MAVVSCIESNQAVLIIFNLLRNTELVYEYRHTCGGRYPAMALCYLLRWIPAYEAVKVLRKVPLFRKEGLGEI